MRIELYEDAGPDGPEAWVSVDGYTVGQADYVGGVGYHVRRDCLLPELEEAIRALEDGPGSCPARLAAGERVGIDHARPTHGQATAARLRPSYRPPAGRREVL